jgi:hypothetical protein
MCGPEHVCCYESLKVARRWVCLFAFLSCLSAGGIVYFALEMDKATVLEKIEDEVEYVNYMNEYDVRQYLFHGLMTLAVFVAIFSCFGMTFKWMRNRPCIMFWGTLLLPLWLLTMGVGLAAIFISFTAADEFEKECDALVAGRKDGSRKVVFTEEGDNLELNLNIYKDIEIDQWMCSVSCPCPAIREGL